MAYNPGVAFFVRFYELDPSRNDQCIFYTQKGARCTCSCPIDANSRAILLRHRINAISNGDVGLEILQEYILNNCCRFGRAQHRDRMEDFGPLLPLAQRWQEEIRTRCGYYTAPTPSPGASTSLPETRLQSDPRYDLRPREPNTFNSSVPSPRGFQIEPPLSEFRPHIAEPLPEDCVSYQILEILIDRDSKSGWVYIFDRASSPGHVKIGWTAKSVSRRLEEWSECGYEPNLLFISDFVPHAQRVEKLTHYELIKEWRRERQCKAESCRKPHQEWFEVKKERAIQVVSDWVKFMKATKPYDSNGRLKSWCRVAVKVIEEKSGTVTAKKLLEHYIGLLSRTTSLTNQPGITKNAVDVKECLVQKEPVVLNETLIPKERASSEDTMSLKPLMVRKDIVTAEDPVVVEEPEAVRDLVALKEPVVAKEQVLAEQVPVEEPRMPTQEQLVLKEEPLTLKQKSKLKYENVQDIPKATLLESTKEALALKNLPAVEDPLLVVDTSSSELALSFDKLSLLEKSSSNLETTTNSEPDVETVSNSGKTLFKFDVPSALMKPQSSIEIHNLYKKPQFDFGLPKISDETPVKFESPPSSIKPHLRFESPCSSLQTGFEFDLPPELIPLPPSPLVETVSNSGKMLFEFGILAALMKPQSSFEVPTLYKKPQFDFGLPKTSKETPIKFESPPPLTKPQFRFELPCSSLQTLFEFDLPPELIPLPPSPSVEPIDLLQEVLASKLVLGTHTEQDGTICANSASEPNIGVSDVAALPELEFPLANLQAAPMVAA